MASDVAKTGKAHELTPFEKFVKHIQDRAELDSTFNSAEELAEKQVLKILTAENENDLFGAMKLEGLTGLRDLESGTELQINGYRLVKSARPDLQGRTMVYAVIDATDLATGEALALDTGIERVITFLVQAERMSALPVSVRLVKKTTGTGNEMITFAPVPARAHQA